MTSKNTHDSYNEALFSLKWEWGWLLKESFSLMLQLYQTNLLSHIYTYI